MRNQGPSLVGRDGLVRRGGEDEEAFKGCSNGPAGLNNYSVYLALFKVFYFIWPDNFCLRNSVFINFIVSFYFNLITYF